MALVFTEAVEGLRQAGARQLLEHREAVALEAGHLAAPEWRGGREREEVRQEVGDLLHEVHAQLVVVEADVHVHAADAQAPRPRPPVEGAAVAAPLSGALLPR